MVYPVALLLAFSLPFAAIPPVVTTPWWALTDEKLVLLAGVAAWLLLGRRALPDRAEWRALRPSLAFVGVALVSAVLAPDFGDDALKFVGRLLAAVFVLLITLRVATQPDQLRGLLWALVVGAGASGLLGLGEALGWPTLQPVLSLFKVAPTRVGGELRVSASFQYATIAAMYFEMATPLALVLAATARRRWQWLLGVGIAVVCTANVVLSLTRAGLLTLAVVCAALLGAACLRSDWRRVLGPTLLSLGVLAAGCGLLLLHDPVFGLRLVTESDADWYGAEYTAPAALSLQPAQSAQVDVDVRNAGRIAWSPSGNHPFVLGYRWLTADGTQVLDLPSGEVPLTHAVAPGETIRLQPVVAVPGLPAGTYRLDWGMVQRDVVQFYERGWADAETQVQVGPAPAGVPVAQPATLPRDDDEAPWVVGRLELWRAALHLFAGRPLLGVGPDNFRHLYGAQLGLETWDERVQANNVYLEVLADTGVLGLAAFAWLIGVPLIGIARRWRAPADAQTACTLLGLGLALLAFLVHGLLDAFLAFTPTASLFWMVVGMILVLTTFQKPQVSGR